MSDDGKIIVFILKWYVSSDVWLIVVTQAGSIIHYLVSMVTKISPPISLQRRGSRHQAKWCISSHGHSKVQIVQLFKLIYKPKTWINQLSLCIQMLLAIQNENFYRFIILWVLNSDWLDNKILVTQDTGGLPNTNFTLDLWWYRDDRDHELT